MIAHCNYKAQISHHRTCTCTAAGGSSQASLGTPSSPIPDDVYQLAVLWKGIWSGLVQQKKRLETIQEAWKAFEDKKEVFVNFLAKAEERVQSVFKVLGTTKDLAVMNAEFGAYQVSVCTCTHVRVHVIVSACVA